MAILEIHLHDTEFSWSVNPGSGKERSLSLRTGSKSKRKSGKQSGSSAASKLASKLRRKSESKSSSAKRRSGQRDRPALGSKLGSVAVLGLVIGGAVAFNRLRSRRRRTRGQAASESTSGRRSSLFRGK